MDLEDLVNACLARRELPPVELDPDFTPARKQSTGQEGGGERQCGQRPAHAFTTRLGEGEVRAAERSASPNHLACS